MSKHEEAFYEIRKHWNKKSDHFEQNQVEGV